MNKIGDLSVDEFKGLVDEAIKKAPKDYFVAEVRKVVIEVVGEKHHEQHEFLTAFIEDRMERKSRLKKIQDVVAGSLVISVILGFLSFIGWATIEAVKHAVKGSNQ